MNSNVNSVNFQGKTEVLYGLKHAANKAKDMEVYRGYGFGPRPVSKDREVYEAKGALKAYLDMAVNDKLFVDTLRDASEDKIYINEIKEQLAPIKTQYGILQPLENFIKELKNATHKTEIKDNSSLHKFLFKICQ